MLREATTTILVFLAATPLRAQVVVQLPEWHTFSVQTSVLVPDRGGAFIGEVDRETYSRSSWALPGWGPLGHNTARAAGTAGSGVLVTASIIDREEMDALVLEEAKSVRKAKGIDLPDGTRKRISAPLDMSVSSVAEIKRSLAADDAEKEAAAERDFKQAIVYEKEGAFSLARSYYRIAAKKSVGAIKEKAMQRLAVLPEPKSVKK